MGYSILEKLLTDNSDINLLRSISNDKMDRPELLSKIMGILEDTGPFIKHLDDAKILSLFRMAKEYFNICWPIYLDTSLGGTGLDKLIDYAESTVYWVCASNGERVATEKEVENGVEQLIPKITYVFDSDTISYIYILLWTFYGHLRYYKRAGLSFTYTDEKLDDTDYQLICKAGQKIRGMIDWLTIKGNYERSVAVLKIAKKNSKYKYPSFASDEITVETSPKQIIYLCKTTFFGKDGTPNQVEAKKILFKMEKNKYKPTPYNIAVMRRAYTEAKTGNIENPIRPLDTDIQSMCDKIEIGLNNGIIAKTDFSLKIISTIKKTGKCSEKQKDVIIGTIIKINKQLDNSSSRKGTNKDAETSDESMSELLKLSEALGSGVLEV